MARKLFPWVGGKDRIIAHLLPRVPYTRVYVEPFFGGGSLFFARRPVQREVINDIDRNLISFWRVVKDPNKFAQLLYLIEMTPYSRADFYEFFDDIRTGGWQEDPEVVRAFKFLYVFRNSYAAKACRTPAVSIAKRAADGVNRGWYTVYRVAIACHRRLRNAFIECDDFEAVFRRYDSPETTFYCDPPYLLSSVRQKDDSSLPYPTMSDEDHLVVSERYGRPHRRRLSEEAVRRILDLGHDAWFNLNRLT